MKRCLKSVIRKMQIKTTARYHLTANRVAEIKRQVLAGMQRNGTFIHSWWECETV